MRRISLVCFLAAASWAQPNGWVTSNLPGFKINSGTSTLKSGVRIRYTSVATPDGSSVNLIATGSSMSDDVFHRFLIDKTTASYFGYDLVLGPGDANGRYQAAFQPLTGDEKMLSHIADVPLKPMMLPKYPPPQTVREGDLIALDVMVSADGKHKITDYIEVLAPPGSPAADPGPDSQDFTVDDGPVTFNGTEHSLWVNGQGRELGAFTGKPGATFWIAFPGQGRYILSLTPHEGFLKSGTMHGDTLSFQDAGQRYDVRFATPIAGQGKVWNLYVLHDMGFQPNPASAGMVSAGTDRLDNLWPKR